jgi:hypothetical protein
MPISPTTVRVTTSPRGFSPSGGGDVGPGRSCGVPSESGGAEERLARAGGGPDP